MTDHCLLHLAQSSLLLLCEARATFHHSVKKSLYFDFEEWQMASAERTDGFHTEIGAFCLEYP